MTKLSDTQRVILSRAAQHGALLAEPPARLPAAARQSVLRSLITKGLLEEVPAPREAIALGWRQDEDGAWIALRITAAGLEAIGVSDQGEAAELEDAGDGIPGASDAAPSRDRQETADLPTVPQGDSLAASAPPPPLTSGEAPGGPQRQPVSQHGSIAPLGTGRPCLRQLLDDALCRVEQDRLEVDRRVVGLTVLLVEAEGRLHLRHAAADLHAHLRPHEGAGGRWRHGEIALRQIARAFSAAKC